MVNIKTLDLNISCILQKVCDGEKIFRINLDNMTVTDLGDKTINVIRRDEYKYPDKYVYFIVEKEEKKMFICATTGFKCTFCCPGACVSRKVREIEEPDKASYMKDERCPGDFTLESAYYDGAYRK